MKNYTKLYAQLARYFNPILFITIPYILNDYSRQADPQHCTNISVALQGTNRTLGGYKILRPQLTKYCRGCVPSGVDAPVVSSVIFIKENENGENEKLTNSLTKTKTQK